MDARVQPQLAEAAGLDEQVDALARGQLAGRVLPGDPLLAAAEARGGAALGQVFDEGTEQGGRGVGIHGK
jgi:hypothetical protein